MQWLKSVTQAWKSRIEEAEKSKDALFGKTAKQLWNFLTRSYSDLYISPGSRDDDDVFPVNQGPLYKPRLNKCQEYLDLYLPHLLSELRGRAVLPNRPQLPEPIYSLPVPMPDGQAVPYGMIDAQARLEADTASTIFGWWLNYTPQEYDLLKELRLAATEALVKGRGMVVHELMPTGTGLLPVNIYKTVDDLLIDPDTTTIRDAGYIFIKQRMPAWLASKKLNIEESKLLNLAQKQFRDSKERLGEPARDPYPREVEMVEYTEVWSRIGVGHVMVTGDPALKNLNEALDSLGPFVFLAIAEGADEPLNLHEDLLIETPEQLRQAIEWPLETFGEIADPWPLTLLDFRPNTDNAWAKSPLEPGLPLQVFIDHLYAYLMSRVIRAAKTVVVLPEDADQRLVAAFESGRDMVVTRISAKELGEAITEKLYGIIEIPPLKQEVWQLLETMDNAFRMAVGLDPFLYGAGLKTEPRSAEMVSTRSRSASMRANQMSRDVDQWFTRITKKEALITRMHVGPEVVSRVFAEPYNPSLGQVGPLSSLWGKLINTTDPYEAARDYQYSIIPGSGRPRDQESEMQATMMLAQTLLPVLLQVAAKTGDFSQYNAFLDRMAKGTMTNLSDFRIQMQQPPTPQGPPGPPGPQGPPPNGQATKQTGPAQPAVPV